MSVFAEFNGSRSIRIALSGPLTEDIRASVAGAYDRYGSVNIPVIAEKVRLRHESDNVALEDIEAEVMRVALAMHAIISFDSNQVS